MHMVNNMKIYILLIALIVCIRNKAIYSPGSLIFGTKLASILFLKNYD